jgi:predicted RNase H-like nuclease (RuvC/YqgF family)
MEVPMAGHEMIRAADPRPTTATAIKAQIRLVQVEIANLETLVAQRQAEFRATHEREEAERLMAELLRLTAELMSARAAAARLEGDLGALRALRALRPWWWRVLTSDTLG